MSASCIHHVLCGFVYGFLRVTFKKWQRETGVAGESARDYMECEITSSEHKQSFKDTDRKWADRIPIQSLKTYRVRSALDKGPWASKDPTQPDKLVGPLKQKTLQTIDDIPSPAEAKRLTQWNGVLSRHFSKVTQSYCQHWFHTSGDHLWTLRAWGNNLCQEPVSPVFWTPTPLCFFIPNIMSL